MNAHYFKVHAEKMKLRVLADDLSGACDCVAGFALARGTSIPVYLDDRLARGDGSWALDLDSRSDDERVARQKVERIMRSFSHDSSMLIFKKIDSTLRGNIAAEVAGALEALADSTGVIVSPALPEQGRTLLGGKLFVHGRLYPIEGSKNLPGILEAAGFQCALLRNEDADPAKLRGDIEHALAQGARAVVVDAQNEADLDRLARALSGYAGRVLLAGSAGLAKAFARTACNGQAQDSDSAQDHAIVALDQTVAIIGSFSTETQAQLRLLKTCSNVDLVECSATEWLDRSSVKRQRAIGLAQKFVAQGRSVVYAISGGPSGDWSRELVKAIAEAALPSLLAVRSLLLVGGDTARAVLEQLNILQVNVVGELEPGISTCRVQSGRSETIYIKAGSFGDADTLQRFFSRASRSITEPCRASATSDGVPS